jgi:glucosylceramidase
MLAQAVLLLCSLARALALGRAAGVLTSAAGARFAPLDALPPWAPLAGGGLRVNFSFVRQTISGFGSALTEAAAFNFAALSEATRAQLVTLLWAPPPAGNGYALGRLHLGSSDFALSTYSLDDAPDDFFMSFFDSALSHDARFVLPLARAALAASNNALKLFFSPWSPPAWMKQSGSMIDSTHPEGLVQSADVQAALALYFVKFVKAMATAGIPIWGCTLQNEPLIDMTGKPHHYEACAYTAASQAAFLRDFLGPAVRADPATHSLKLLAYDWNKAGLASWASTIAAAGGGFSDGLAFHWYDWSTSLYLDELANVSSSSPAPFMLATEACLIKSGVAAGGGDSHGTLVGAGAPPGNGSVAYTYAAGELYALDLIGDIKFGTAGFVDWNAVLDYSGGPNHINRTDIGAPILVDPPTDSFYVQSPYYYVGHVSRFAPPGSLHIACSGRDFASTPQMFDAVKDYVKPQISGGAPPAGSVPLVAACFASADFVTGVVVIMNANAAAATTSVAVEPRAGDAGGTLPLLLPPHSIATLSFAL